MSSVASTTIHYWDDERAARGLPLALPTRQQRPSATPPAQHLPPQTRSSWPYPAEPAPWLDRAPIVAPLPQAAEPNTVRQAAAVLFLAWGALAPLAMLFAVAI